MNATATCKNDKEALRDYMGIMFCGGRPMAWGCLSDAEVAEVQAGMKARFPGMQIVTVTGPMPAINCPPPQANETKKLDADRAALTKLAPS